MPPTPRLGRAPPAFASRRVGCDTDRLFSCPFRCAKHSAPTIATWRLSFHCGMNAADTSAWQGASSLRVTSSRVRCGPLVLLPLQMRETLGAQPRRLIAVTNQPMRVMLGLRPKRSRAARIAHKSRLASKPRKRKEKMSADDAGRDLDDKPHW